MKGSENVFEFAKWKETPPPSSKPLAHPPPPHTKFFNATFD